MSIEDVTFEQIEVRLLVEAGFRQEDVLAAPNVLDGLEASRVVIVPADGLPQVDHLLHSNGDRLGAGGHEGVPEGRVVQVFVVELIRPDDTQAVRGASVDGGAHVGRDDEVVPRR